MTGKRILIVEDQADLRKLIALTLAGRGYELAEAVDGDSALAEHARFAPDLVLLDLMLPGGIDGIEICRRLRTRCPAGTTRVVLLTAADQAVQRARAAEAGVDHYLPKPFSPKVLRELVASLLGDTPAASG